MRPFTSLKDSRLLRGESKPELTPGCVVAPLKVKGEWR
jgi:hypothetical protein